jgi:hypothetical protein
VPLQRAQAIFDATPPPSIELANDELVADAPAVFDAHDTALVTIDEHVKHLTQTCGPPLGAYIGSGPCS